MASETRPATEVRETNGVRIAFEGCGHGTLDAIYASVDASCAQRGWTDGVDLVIIGGDFQAARNAADLTVMSVPVKYRAMGDFHAYYAGKRTAPYLTLFVGGNHEAASHLWELFYGGWVAPNIYYMGAANVVRLGPLRIAGMSGIWKGVDYRRAHHERLPFSQGDTKSFYHVREADVRKLLQIREPVDIGLSHDWPRGIEWTGDAEHLFRMKPDFRRDATDGSLGSVAAEYVLDRLRPRYWFSAHLHCKFAAVKMFPPAAAEAEKAPEATPAAQPEQAEPVPQKVIPAQPAEVANPDEIDLDIDDEDEPQEQPKKAEEKAEAKEPTAAKQPAVSASPVVAGVSSELLAQLPASFQRPVQPSQPGSQSQLHTTRPGQPVPPTITNTRVDFLALDKCLPGRHFLQLMEVGPLGTQEKQRPYTLEYDPEWLAITRVFAADLVVGDKNYTVPADRGEDHYRPLIDAERKWVDEHIVAAGKLAVPHNFAQTAPVHAPVPGQPETYSKGQPDEYTNPSTAAFCELLQVPNIWDATAEERSERKQRGPSGDDDGRDFGRGRGGGYGGRGRGRGRGGRGRGRGY